MQKMMVKEVKEEPKREPPTKEPTRQEPPRQRASLKDIVTRVFWVTLAVVILLALGGLSYVAYVEFYVIPSLLIPQFGNGAILVHLGFLAILVTAAAGVTYWLSRRGIFQTHEKLMAAHINSTLSAIENLATGRWSSDSYTHKEAFKTGAVLGYKVGQAGPAELDRGLIVEGIGAMGMPQARQLPGQSADVITEMDDFVLDARKQRLSS